MKRFQIQHLLKKNLLSGRVRKKSCQWNEFLTVEERNFNEICAHYLLQISKKKSRQLYYGRRCTIWNNRCRLSWDVDHRRSTADKNFFYRSQGQQSAVSMKGRNRKLENFYITLLQIGNFANPRNSGKWQQVKLFFRFWALNEKPYGENL